MKSEEIKTLFVKFENASAEIEGVECWSARELQKLLGYTQWRRFTETIERAKEACRNAAEDVDYHFADVGKMITVGKGTERQIDDVLLTRYACYLIAQNGDSLVRHCVPLLRHCVPLLRHCVPLLRHCVPLVRHCGLDPQSPQKRRTAA